MVLPFPEQQAALCKNTWWHRRNLILFSVECPKVLSLALYIFDYDYGIDKGISPSSKLVSFADDTKVYSCINDIEKCDQLQIDLNSVYDWTHVNNMF